MSNLNEILNTISKVQEDITLVKIERHDIIKDNTYWNKETETHYTTVIKFKQS